jgi:PKD repeat protein
MKTIKLSIILGLFCFIKMYSQTCTVSFVYSTGPTGIVTFSNTSAICPSVTPSFTWDTGNGMTYTTNSLSQTVSTTYSIGGSYTVGLISSSGGNDFQTLLYAMPGCSLVATMTTSSSSFYSSVKNFNSISTGTNLATTYLWDFGDGASGTGSNPTHLYTSNGAFGYTLIATNNPSCSSFSAAGPWNQASGPPVYVCTYTPTVTYTVGAAGAVSLAVNQLTGIGWFTAWTHSDLILPSYSGPNGTATYTLNENHLYFNGTHTTSVYVVNNYFPWQGCGPFWPAVSITVTNNPCYANAAFTYTTLSGGQVSYSKTAPSTNTNIVYFWYFGDGVSSNLINPTHTFSSAGNYTTYLIAYDSRSYVISNPLDTFAFPCRAVNIVNLNITGIPCVANSNFSVSPTGVPQTYNINMIFPYNVTAAVWNWGDGTTSNLLYSSHTYSAAGNYDICLTVTTSCGTSTSTCFSQYLAKGVSGNMVYVRVVAPPLSNSIETNVDDPLSMELFPNPVNDGILNLKMNKEIIPDDIEVCDLLGKSIAVYPVLNSRRSFEIDVSTLNSGLYFLRLKSSQYSPPSKFIISR